MANSVYNYAANIFVRFHIGRGGRFHNQGHKTYIGTVKGLSDCFGDALIISEDENGNALPDKDWQLLDGAGNIILDGRDAIESNTGVLDWDGDYNTDIVRHINECSDEEYQLIIDEFNRGGYVDDDVIDYACQATDQLRAKRIQFTEDGGVDVQTQYKTAHFTPSDFADRESAKEELKFMGFIEESAERISCAMDDECWFDEVEG